MNHTSLKHLLPKKEFNARKQKWMSKIQYFYFDIEYKMGNSKFVVDALSRKPTFVVLKIHDDWKAQLAI